MTNEGNNPQILDDAALMKYIGYIRHLARQGLRFAEILQHRANIAREQYGAKSAYVEQHQRAASLAAAGAESLAQDLARLLNEKATRIHAIQHPRNGNAAHERAADVQAAMNDHHRIVRGQ